MPKMLNSNEATPVMRRSFVLLCLSLLLAAPGVFAQPLPKATPESVGMSTERLNRMHAAMQALVDTHQVGGVVTLVARDGKMVDLQTYGFLDADQRTPLRTDSLFRIMSMSKPVTSVAAMMLFEEGKLALTDPVSKFIPAFREMKVVSRSAQGAEFTPARRQITVRDLLTHRSGLTYGFLDNGPVGDAYRTGGVSDGLGLTEGTLEQNVDRLSKVPLVSQPGSDWHYSLSTDVLGRVVEVASGMPLDRFFKERIFGPLKMTETGFDVADSKWPRLATVYTPDGGGGVRPMRSTESFGNTHFAPDNFKPGKAYFSGGAGLVSNVNDYTRFAQMLANGGILDGVRLLGPKTVELMTTSHTLDLNLANTPVIGAGAQWGLGFKITSDLGATQQPGSVGMYGWSGILGTFFFIDPKEKLVGVMMVQRYPGSPAAAPFQSLTYQAITSAR